MNNTSTFRNNTSIRQIFLAPPAAPGRNRDAGPRCSALRAWAGIARIRINGYAVNSAGDYTPPGLRTG